MRQLAVISLALLLIACKPPTFEEGLAALRAKDKPKAVEIFTPLADKGDVRAQTELGLYYSKDETKDPEKAFKYFKMAADQGQLWANYEVGDAYAKGEGVEKNLGYAEQRYLKAANGGLVFAMTSLVSLYRNNDLLSYDNRTPQIRRWAMAAFERGSAISYSDIQDTYPPFSPDYIAWKNVYIKINENEKRTLPASFRIEQPDPKQKIAVLGKEQEIMRLYKHIEPPTSFPWR